MTRWPGNGSALGLVLAPAEAAFAAAARARNRLYDRGLLRQVRLGAPVVSVGNIVVGGAGKTPLVIALARAISDAGLRVAVLTRGYRGRGERGVHAILPGAGADADPALYGDEPVLVARRVPAAIVVVGADRVRSGLRAVETHGAQVLLLDDGFQHRGLGRDLDVVVLRAPRPFGNGCQLPRGPLREPVEALRRAQLLALNTTDGPLADPLPRWLADLVPLVELRYRPGEVIHLADQGSRPTEWLRGRRVLVAAAVADPRGVARLAEGAGARVVRLCARRDHHPWSGEELGALRRQAQQRGATLLLTEKDAVKWRRPEPGAVALRLEMEIVAGRGALRQALGDVLGGAQLELP